MKTERTETKRELSWAPLVAGLFMSLTALPVHPEEIQQGLWEITSQKFVGESPSPVGKARTTKECVDSGWLKKRASQNEQMAKAFGECSETASTLTPTSWSASYECTAGDTTMQVQYEIAFHGDVMEGQTDANGTVKGKIGREQHRMTGRYLGSCR